MFTRVEPVRASQDVVRQIRQAILDGRLSPGDRLPPERELTEQFGLSRITIREALRVLEAKGLIEIKVGAAGGAYVRNANLDPIRDNLETMIRLQKVDWLDLIEAHKAIETSIATLAAERATSEDFDAMEEALTEAREALAAGRKDSLPFSVAFHAALARAAKNQVLLFIMNSFCALYYEAMTEIASPEVARCALKDHRRIYEAILDRDGEKARTLTNDHIDYMRRLMKGGER